jgi:hypothetical protein
MNIIIAGSRYFSPASERYYDATIDALRELESIRPLGLPSDVTIFSGAATGVDKIGEGIALRYGFYLRQFPARWAIHGKKAGILRNQEMAAQADALVLIWDGVSRGSANMFLTAKRKGLTIVQRILSPL